MTGDKREAEDSDTVEETGPDITDLSLAPPIRVARLDGRQVHEIDLTPDAEARSRIAELLGLEALRKFRFRGSLRPLGRSDWELHAELGATVVQPCVVSLHPVVTRIDESVTRRFLTEMPEPEGTEIEMPEDDSAEPLGQFIDISALALEALSLALPAHPRADGEALSEAGRLEQAPPGQAPLQDEGKPNPFAALAGLRDKLNGAGDN